MKPETIKKLLDNGMTTTQLVETLHTDQKIQTTINQTKQQITQLTKQYEVDLHFLRNTIQTQQNSCPHHETTYHPDPSGNNDHHHTCNTCGKEIKN